MMPAGGLFIGQFFAAAVTYPIPNRYESHAVVGIMDGESTVTANQSPERPLLHISHEELNSVLCDESLKTIIGALNLSGMWKMNETDALSYLRSMLRIERLPRSRLMRISANSTSPNEALFLVEESVRLLSEGQIGGYVKSSEAELAKAKTLIAKLEDDLEKSSKKEMRRAMAAESPSDDAVRKDLIGEEVLEDLRRRYKAGMIEKRVQKNPLFIKETPEVQYTPVSPNITLNLQIGAIGGVLFFSILSFPLMFFLERRRLKKL